MYKFSSYTTANRFRNRCLGLMLIVLGDAGEYIVCTPKAAAELVKKGYEYAE